MRWELLDRYLAGECTVGERADVECWLAASPAVRAFLEQLTNPAPSDAPKAEVWARLERELGPGLKLGGNGA